MQFTGRFPDATNLPDGTSAGWRALPVSFSKVIVWTFGKNRLLWEDGLLSTAGSFWAVRFASGFPDQVAIVIQQQDGVHVVALLEARGVPGLAGEESWF